MENMTKEQEWIRLKDRLPEHGQKVDLWLVPMMGIKARRMTWTWESQDSADIIINDCRATYWKPFSEPPTASGSVAAPKPDTLKDYHAYLNYEDVQKENEALKESIKELLPLAEERLKRIVNYDMPDYYRIRSGIQSSISRAKALLDKQ